jgi:hypothetical protein
MHEENDHEVMYQPPKSSQSVRTASRRSAFVWSLTAILLFWLVRLVLIIWIRRIISKRIMGGIPCQRMEWPVSRPPGLALMFWPTRCFLSYNSLGFRHAFSTSLASAKD